MDIELDPEQIKAIAQLSNGSILAGGVGSGKSRTSIAYFMSKVCKARFKINGGGDESEMTNPTNLVIITTAKKRDTFEWEDELALFGLYTAPEGTLGGLTVIIESWNNLKKFEDVRGAFFIFDEQRLVGYGAWVKAFLKIAKHNKWILLSATPGDVWMDYIPVFLANGFYRNKTEFIMEHVIYSRFSKYPKVDRYVNTARLYRQREALLVAMPVARHTVHHRITKITEYDQELSKTVMKDRWHHIEERPIRDMADLIALLRKISNSDPSRLETIRELLVEHPRMIIFYNFNYELDILRTLSEDFVVAEWNGQKHEPVPEGDSWVYLVQYTAGAEGWNCTTTDTIVFYSLNYAYRAIHQAEGRIDRMDTPYTDLYYYTLRSMSAIDSSIMKALKQKKTFNERSFKNVTV